MLTPVFIHRLLNFVTVSMDEPFEQCIGPCSWKFDLCLIMSHYVDAHETIYCTNCGVSSTTETCKRCMEMTQCPSCKRRLPSYCYFAGSGSLCEVSRVANITVFIDVVVAAVAADVVVFMNVSVVTRLCNTFVQVV